MSDDCCRDGGALLSRAGEWEASVRVARATLAFAVALILALFLCWTQAAFADVAVPPLTGRVVDLTNTLSSERHRGAVDRGCRICEQRKGSQIAVLIVPTTAARDHRAILDPRRGSLEDRPQEDRRRRAAGRRQGRPQAAHRGRLRPRRRADRRHRAAHHRRDDRAALQERRFCRRHRRRAHAHDRRDRRRAAARAGAAGVARPGRRLDERLSARLSVHSVGSLFVGGILRALFGRLARLGRSAGGVVAVLAWFMLGSIACIAQAPSWAIWRSLLVLIAATRFRAAGHRGGAAWRLRPAAGAAAAAGRAAVRAQARATAVSAAGAAALAAAAPRGAGRQ